MDLQQAKDTLNRAGFSEESSGVINEVLDGAIARGHVTAEEKTKLLAVIDIEIEAANIEADAMEEVATVLESFASEVDGAVEKAEKEIKSADNDLLSEVKESADLASNS